MKVGPTYVAVAMAELSRARHHLARCLNVRVVGARAGVGVVGVVLALGGGGVGVVAAGQHRGRGLPH